MDSLPIQHLGSRFPNKCLCASGIVGDREGLRRKETEPRWGGPRLVSFAPLCEEGQETGKVTDAGDQGAWTVVLPQMAVIDKGVLQDA